MKRNIFLVLLLVASALCAGESIIDFNNPLEAPESIRDGVFHATGKPVLFPYRPFLPYFNRGEIVLSVAEPGNNLSFTLILLDKKNRRFYFPLKRTDEGSRGMTYTVLIDSAVAYPCILEQEQTTCIPEQPLRAVALEIRGHDGPIRFRSLEFFERGVMLSLNTGKTVSVLDLTTDAFPVLEAVNGSSVTAEIELKYAVADARGTVVESDRRTLDLKPGQTRKIPLKRPVLQGVYTVDYTFSEKERNSRFRARFAAMAPAKPKKDAWPLGFCEHFQRYSWSDNEKMTEYLALCGANEVRLSWLWNQVNPIRNTWNFTRIDRLVDLLEQNGIEPMALMGAAPGHATATDYKRTNERGLRLPRPEAYEEWLRRFATRYDGRIRKFCVWNEPDVAHFADFDETEYLQLQRIAHRTLKAVNPDNEVIAGGFSYMLTPYSRKFLELMAKEAPDSIDTISTHLYAPLSRFPETLADCRRYLKNLGLKQPLCNEETGAGTTDDLEQLPVLFQKVIQCRAEGFKLFYWYNLRNCGFNPADREQNFGLLEYDLNPRAGYVTFNMLAGLYGDSRFIRAEVWNNLAGFRFESTDSALYALWLKKQTQTETLAIFETDAEKVELVDLFGNAKLLAPENGRVIAPIDSDGQTLRLFPASASLRLIGEALVPEHLAIRSGEEKEFLFLGDLLPKNVTLQVLPIDGLTIAPAIREADSRFRIPIRATKEFRAKKAGPFRVQLMEGERKIGPPLGFRFQAIYEVPYGKMSKVGTIARRDQVRHMLPDTPEYGTLFWTDYQDCSVQFGATAEQQGSLHFQIGMDDDVHVQNFSAEKMWKGDSIQIVLRFPGQNDYWEFGVAMTGDGEILKHIWRGPQGMDLQKALAGIRVKGINREQPPDARYRFHHNFYVVLSLAAFGTNTSALEKGVYFNILANDNDGKLRESQLSFMGDGGTDPEERITPDSPLLVVTTQP